MFLKPKTKREKQDGNIIYIDENVLLKKVDMI